MHEEKESPVSSSTASASIQERRRMAGPGRSLPMIPITDVGIAKPEMTSMPSIESSTLVILEAVIFSSNASSGN
ncbi:hypothetical protein SDC9_192427 [bioreactor metagenome]|uniref:Uncharacterized protein n=1 Tax=bioreactor metagenome TaxID=1076179 RepID=A0A645I138_9ZZZZ